MNSKVTVQQPGTDNKIALFDPRSGSLPERLLFRYRRLIVLFCLLVSATLAWQAQHLRLSAAFESMIPVDHPYIQNYFQYRGQLGEGGNTLRIAVKSNDGSIYNTAYLETLKQLNDDLFLLTGWIAPT